VLEGQRIRKGALLAEIDPRDFKVDLMAKEGRYIQAKAEKERYENLYKKQSISKNELDQKTAVYLEAKSAYDAAQNALKDTRMYAPFDAFVGKKLVENYEEIRAKQNILTLIDMSVMEVVTHLPEALAVQRKNFSGYSVEFETFPGVIFSADLKELDKKHKPEGYPLTLYLKGPESGDKTYNIVPGFTCKVNIHLQDTEGKMSGDKVIVPLSAIFEGQNDDHPSVWIFDKEKGTVNKRKIVVEEFISDNSVIVSEGIHSGEWVITAGVHRLSEGDVVKELQEKL
jgi:RND family efflux transporter MFP subunit